MSMSIQNDFEKYATADKLAVADPKAIEVINRFIEEKEKIAATLPEDNYWVLNWRNIVNEWNEDAVNADWFAVRHIYNAAREAGLDHETAQEVSEYYMKKDLLDTIEEPPQGVSEEKLEEIYNSAALVAAGHAAEFLWDLQDAADGLEEAAELKDKE